MGLVAPWEVESSWIRDRICVAYIGRQIFIHGTTSEALHLFLNQHILIAFLYARNCEKYQWCKDEWNMNPVFNGLTLTIEETHIIHYYNSLWTMAKVSYEEIARPIHCVENEEKFPLGYI